MDSGLDLAGLVPAVVTPMRPNGEIDEDGLRRYIRWLLAFDGLKALAVKGRGDGRRARRPRQPASTPDR